ncbi:MAG: hypothetical protein KatS3mg110_0604 [Pirellulaceae bacterium]|nr:MAG: hypothetical protein KatS3mg110_0604 [Pirellulaceae bacterium]
MSSRPTIYVVLLGPSAVGKTTMQALMCNPAYAQLPRQIRLSPATASEAAELQKVSSELRNKIDNLKPWKTIDISRLIPTTPATSQTPFRRDFVVGLSNMDDGSQGYEKDFSENVTWLFGICFLDFAGGLLTQKPDDLAERIANSVRNGEALLIPVIDAVRLMELPFSHRNTDMGMAFEKMAKVMASLSQRTRIFCPCACITRCETYNADWATEADRRRFYNLVENWCRDLRGAICRQTGQSALTSDWLQLDPQMCHTTGCLRVREVRRIPDADAGWNFVFERVDAEFSPRNVAMPAIEAFLHAARCAKEARSGWRQLWDYITGREAAWKRLLSELENRHEELKREISASR